MTNHTPEPHIATIRQLLLISITSGANNSNLVTDRGVDSDTVEAIRACGSQVTVPS